METSDDLNAILERVKAKTSTVNDLEILQKIVNSSTFQNISQAGKYNVNAGHGTLNVGDRYGPSVEDIRAIVQELQMLQPQSNPINAQQHEQVFNNEPLAVLTIEAQVIELINFRLAAIEELQKASHLSNTQQIEFNAVKGKIRSFTGINQELEVLAGSVDRILQEAVRTLAAKLKELDSFQGENLLEARSQICLREQIELLEQFQTELGDGKVVAHWLNRQRSQYLAQDIGQRALNLHPQTKETTSPRSLEAFYFSIDQFLEQLSHCLTWGRTNSIDNSTTPIVLADEIYVAAFERLKNMIPAHLPDGGIKQLKEFIDYLVQSLPNHRHLSID